MAEQISLFDIIPFEVCQKSQEQNDIDFLVRRGSGFCKGKLRILSYYQLNNPKVSEFANFLAKEYGIGGWSDGIRSEDHSNKGIKFQWKERKYLFSWTAFAKLVAKSIEADEYVTEKDLPKNEYFKVQNPSSPFGYLCKSYSFGDAYGKKIIVAHLSSVTMEQVKDVKWFTDYCHLNCHVDIGIHELLDGIDSGAYESIEELWEDIRFSGRRLSPSSFGGRMEYDKDKVQELFDDYKKTGYAMGYKAKNPLYEYPRLTENAGTLFFHLRLRVKNGELSKEYFNYVHGKCELEE